MIPNPDPNPNPNPHPNPNPNPHLDQVGQKPKQQFIQTFDFSVLSLLLAAVATTIKFPHKLAFIIIHTDQYGVAAEQATPTHSAR